MERNDYHGEKHHMAKLTLEQVEHIRANYIPYHPTRNFGSFARKFGVSVHAVRSAYWGWSWRQAETPQLETIEQEESQ